MPGLEYNFRYISYIREGLEKALWWTEVQTRSNTIDRVRKYCLPKYHQRPLHVVPIQQAGSLGNLKEPSNASISKSFHDGAVSSSTRVLYKMYINKDEMKLHGQRGYYKWKLTLTSSRHVRCMTNFRGFT